MNGNLRRFRIADFAHHDLVRVVAENGAQAAGECQPLFFVNWDLRDAANLIFDRIFNGDNFVFVSLDFIHRRVKRGRFAAARWAGDQHHAVWFFDVTAKLS